MLFTESKTLLTDCVKIVYIIIILIIWKASIKVLRHLLSLYLETLEVIKRIYDIFVTKLCILGITNLLIILIQTIGMA